MDSNEIMTVEEVAEFVRVSERTVYDWAKKGEIPCGKLGSIWRFKRSEIYQWVNDHLGSVRREPYNPPVALDNVLSPERVRFMEKATKNQVLDTLIGILGASPEVADAEELRKGIYHREELMSTGIGLGVAIPHVRLKSVRNIIMAVAVCHDGVQGYESMDESPVRLVFMIAGGEKQHAEHLKLLSFITTRLKKHGLAESLLEAKDPESFSELLAGRG